MRPCSRCSPAWSTQPMITSSTSAGSALVRASSASMTWADRSTGCQPSRLPRLRRRAGGRDDMLRHETLLRHLGRDHRVAPPAGRRHRAASPNTA
jgi:hypothetical protein